MRIFARKNGVNFPATFINKLLENKNIRKKHLVVYLLEYIRDYGFADFFSSSFRAIKSDGIKSILSPRKALIDKIKQRGMPVTKPVKLFSSVADLNSIRKSILSFSNQPKISFILPVYNTKAILLHKAIQSIKKQVYENWELCIIDDFSTLTDVRKVLNDYSVDNQIKIIYLPSNKGIAEASNAGIAIATGDYIAFIDHDDEVTPDALYWFVNELNETGEADIFYSDECKIDEKGNLSDYFFKPDWSPELLLNMMYVGHLSFFRKDFLDSQVELFRKEYDFSQDYDFMLRTTEKTISVKHIEKVLYYWRITKGSASQGDKPYARQTNIAALDSAMKRRGIASEIIELNTANRVKLIFDNKPTVSIIIPSDSFINLTAAIEKIVEVTSYSNYELVIVTNDVVIEQLKKHFDLLNLKLVNYNKSYNFSDKCNVGAGLSNNEILIFLNDDVRPLESDWIENVVEYLFLPGVGAVSPKLIYEDNTIQYAGMTTGVRNLVGTTFHKYHSAAVFYNNYIQLVRNVSVLSGACLAIKKTNFLSVGGFDAINTPIAHSDLDLSFKIMDIGLRNVYTPYATLLHIGHLSLSEYEKKYTQIKDKADIFLLKRWMKYLSEDQYFTESMKQYLYHDSRAYFRIYGSGQKKQNTYNGDILVATHDLTLSGAPLNLFDLCKILKANNYFVVVISPSEGPLKELYYKEGIPVIIDELLLSQESEVRKFASNFDYLFCNTIVTWPLVKQMQQILPVFWWIQEARLVDDFVQNPDCLQTLNQAETVIGLSEYALSFISKYNSSVIKIYNSCFDRYKPGKEKPGNILKEHKVIISLIGSIEKRKGQDMALEALHLLDTDVLNKLEIRFIGRYQDPHFARKLKRKAKNIKEVVFYGEVDHQACEDLIRETDIMLNTSRDEPLSVALVEGFCLAKPCIVSDQTGIAELVVEGVNGFIYRHGDENDLASKLVTVINNASQLKAMGLEARRTYETFLSVSEFEKKMLHLLNVKTAEFGQQLAIV